MRHRSGFVLFLILMLTAILLPGPGAAGPGDRGVPDYPMMKINPTGFGVYQGILGWTPVSATKAIAFARNKSKTGRDFSLDSFALSADGVFSGRRTFASGLGTPADAACVWLADGAAGGDRAGGAYGLVFVLFERWFSNYDQASVYVARFNSSGARTSDWSKIFTADSPKGWYITDENLFAARGDRSIGVVPSLAYYESGGDGIKTVVGFLEADIEDGSLIGGAKQIPLPAGGQDIEGLGFAPAWNGKSWLVPLAATFYRPGGGWDAMFKNELFIGVVSGGTSQAAVLNKIQADKIASLGTYEAVLAPYPGSAADSALFVRHRTPIPEAQQKRDMFKYDFSLKRLNIHGRSVKSTPVSIPAYAHKIAYNPAFEIGWDWESWTQAAPENGTVLLSRARTIEFDSESAQVSKYEHEVDFYGVDILTGAVAHKARAVFVLAEATLFRPIIGVFPNGPVAVVNCLYRNPPPYPWDNYLTTFER